MLHDIEQAGVELQINMNETLDDMFVVICDKYLIFYDG